ncbi:MAG: glycosyltransferase [Pseudomonadota bacterium]|nr:glycosyltransferase [Pseudomonadota bacterium]
MDTVGLAMIVRDTADTLDVCLASVKGLFEQIVIVDTGSVDSTIDIARRYTDEVYSIPWTYDFAAARNVSWQYLQTDWKFWLDGDDILVGREYFDELVSKCAAQGLDGAILEYFYAFDAVGAKILAQLEPSILSRQVSAQYVFDNLKPRCITTQYRERLVRNDPSWTWLYPIHEALPAAGRRLGKYDKVKIIHRRHTRVIQAPTRRNLDILDRVPTDRRDERIWFYYGLEHASAGDIDQAIEAFEKFLPLGTVEDERYLANHYLADLYRAKGDLPRSSDYDLRAVAIRPMWRDAYAGLLETSVRQQDWLRAIYYGAQTKKAEIPDTPFAFNPLHEEVGWVGDYVRALVEIGQHEEALAEVERALTVVPEDSAFNHNADVLSVSLNIKKGSQAIANAIEFFLRHDDAETAALILARLSPELRKNRDIQEWTKITGEICGRAASGGIAQEPLKIPPSIVVAEDLTEQDSLWWYDIRMKYIQEQLALRPHIQKVLQVGGPVEVRQAYIDMGLEGHRVEYLHQIVGEYDAVILWNALERAKNPEELVARARQVIAPGGELIVIVSNGPNKKGLAPPDAKTVRLRAFSIDALRQVVGTTRLPTLIEGWSAEAGDLYLSVPLPLLLGRSKSIAIVCPGAPEPWGPWSLGVGIGGSEEAVVRLSRAFTRRGHNVTVYGSGWVGEDKLSSGPMVLSYGPRYLPISEYKPADVVLGWRYPEIFLNQIRPFDGEWRALWLHDSIDKERVAAAAPFLDKIWCISDYHAGLYSGIPGIYKGRNGIDAWEFPQEAPERNPAKLMYVSTPFRGLGQLLERHWPQIKQAIPEAELHCYYGWESADKMGATSTPDGAAFKLRVMELCKQPGVVWHGRVGQPELYREFMTAGVWSYYSTWAEENCISSYIAQAGGAWPVVTPIGALPQSSVFGWKARDGEFVSAIIEAVRTEDGRERMMEWARKWTSWDDCAAAWERLWLGYEA